MKKGFYPRLAWMGITKNKQLCFPYILTCIGMVMMYYIMKSLSVCELLYDIRGGGNLVVILTLGRGVIAVFALIFLFYTNSFLIRRRNREFGLYNILGMDKTNIAKIISIESLITAFIGLFGGLFFGIALSKFAELGLLRMIRAEVDFSFRVPVSALTDTIITFAVIFMLIFLFSILQVGKSDPLELLRSENAGEKPPKANWLLALTGLLLLGGAYVIALRLKDPASAMLLFFVAVIMVIVGTFALMTAGSVTLCRILQKNKGFYYRKNHFVSVSSMAFRMKRNGAGLASICILCTMVLVMISSSLSLYIGADESIRTRYPREIGVTLIARSGTELTDGNIPAMRAKIDERLDSLGAKRTNSVDYRYANLAGVYYSGQLFTAPDSATLDLARNGMAGYAELVLIPLDDYRALSGDGRTLESGVVFARCDTIKDLPGILKINSDTELKVAGTAEKFTDNGNAMVMAMDTIYVVTPDFEAIAEAAENVEDDGEMRYLPTYGWYLGFDLEGDADEEKAALAISDIEGEYERFMVQRRSEERSDFYETFGGLFFIGIVLSLVFMTATVLIIYYKQISEGYEDRPRFDIMQKIGMTLTDIKKSVNSQVLTVFFAPLCLAGLHMAFAFPFIWRMLQLFALTNVKLIATVTVAAFALFAIFYIIVYAITSNEYYKIVSRAEGRVQ